MGLTQLVTYLIKPFSHVVWQLCANQFMFVSHRESMKDAWRRWMKEIPPILSILPSFRYHWWRVSFDSCRRTFWYLPTIDGKDVSRWFLSRWYVLVYSHVSQCSPFSRFIKDLWSTYSAFSFYNVTLPFVQHNHAAWKRSELEIG